MIKRITISLLVTALAIFAGCSGDPLLTDLVTNNLKVIIKGTYESENPRGWMWPSSGSDIVDNSVNIYPVDTSSETFPPSTFMLDITGMRLVRDGKSMKFGNKRLTYSCGANDDNADFFNGKGIEMRNDDVDSRSPYTRIDFYMRKLLFSNAREYQLRSDGWHDHGYTKTYFEEKKTEAFSFNQLLVNYLYDTFRNENDDEDTNRIYPICIDITNGMLFDPRQTNVIEVRFLIKNFVKLYEYNRLDYSSDEPYIVHYFGVSDYLRDVRAGENTIGGNLIAVARSYVVGHTGSVTGTAGAGYVIGIPADGDINDYVLPSDNLRNDKMGAVKDIPTAPEAADDNMPALLMYCMEQEQYKIDWNKFVTAVNGAAKINDPQIPNAEVGGNDTNFYNGKYSESQKLFEEKWTDYETAAANFKIPPLAVYVKTAGSFTINNIAPGDYKFYHTSQELKFGKLFTGTGSAVFTKQFTANGSETVTITDGGVVTLN